MNGRGIKGHPPEIQKRGDGDECKLVLPFTKRTLCQAFACTSLNS